MRFNYKTLLVSAVLLSVCYADDYTDKMDAHKKKLEEFSKQVTAGNASSAIEKSQKEFLTALDEAKTQAESDKDKKKTISGDGAFGSVKTAYRNVLDEAISEDYKFMALSSDRLATENKEFKDSLANVKMDGTGATDDEKKGLSAAAIAKAAPLIAGAKGALTEIETAVQANQEQKVDLKLAADGKNATAMTDEEKTKAANDKFYNTCKKQAEQTSSFAKSLLRSDAMTIVVSIGSTILATAAVVSVAIF